MFEIQSEPLANECLVGFDTLFQDSVAIKINYKTNSKNGNHSLAREHEAYTALHGGPGIPDVRYFKECVDSPYDIMVMDRLGPNLEELRANCDPNEGRYNLDGVLLIADQLLDTFEHMHNSGILHRDVKPENFVMGRPGSPDENSVFIVDFGRAMWMTCSQRKNRLRGLDPLHGPFESTRAALGEGT